MRIYARSSDLSLKVGDAEGVVNGAQGITAVWVQVEFLRKELFTSLSSTSWSFAFLINEVWINTQSC